MASFFEQERALLEYVAFLDSKRQLSKTVEEDYFEPGMMENLEQYLGEYDQQTQTIRLRVEMKGLRYEERTAHLEGVALGQTLQTERDAENPYNSNNFEVFSKGHLSLGCLPADFCNVLAPLVDQGLASITSTKACYIEKVGQRSRYATQGVLFVEMTIRLLISE